MICTLVLIFATSALVAVTAIRLAKLVTMKMEGRKVREKTMNDTERISRLKALENLRYRLTGCNQRLGFDSETSKYLLKNKERDLLLDLIGKEELEIAYPSVFQKARNWIYSKKAERKG